MGWFGLCWYLPIAMKAAQAEQEARAKRWESMPPELVAKEKEELQQELKELKAHQRALEVARAGRSKNFLETLFGG